ncbi:MAG: hypothetical protein HYZ28_11155 [Myxococcales bacterium]|nr:hypothetical protein [Myxococcales bacterium]
MQVPPLLVSASRVSLALEDDATIGQVNQLLAELGATIVGGAPDMALLEIAVVPDASGAGAAVQLASGHPGIAVASYDLGGAQPQLLPPAHDSDIVGEAKEWRWATADGGSNWGLKQTGAPFAWNLRDRLAAAAAKWGARPRVLVFDDGFRKHADLWMHDDSEFGATVPDLTRHPCNNIHGLCVSGVLNARFDASGIEGVVPVDVRPLGYRVTESMERDLHRLRAVLSVYPELRLVNYSNGVQYVTKEAQRLPTSRCEGAECKFSETIEEMVRRLGETWARSLDRFAAANQRELLDILLQRGDGCVDMADLRALRDAIRLAPKGDGIDTARLDNPKRDLNGDGVVKAASAGKSWVPDEDLFSRFDLNVDQKLDPGDLLELHPVWGNCGDPTVHKQAAPQLEGHAGASYAALFELLGTRDYRLPVASGSQTLTATGATSYEVDGASPFAVHDGGYAPISARVSCGGAVRACVLRPGADEMQLLCDDGLLAVQWDQWAKPVPPPEVAPLSFKSDRGTFSGTSCGGKGCFGDLVFGVGGVLLPPIPLDGFDGPFVPSPKGGVTAGLPPTRNLGGRLLVVGPPTHLLVAPRGAGAARCSVRDLTQ